MSQRSSTMANLGPSVVQNLDVNERSGPQLRASVAGGVAQQLSSPYVEMAPLTPLFLLARLAARSSNAPTAHTYSVPASSAPPSHSYTEEKDKNRKSIKIKSIHLGWQGLNVFVKSIRYSAKSSRFCLLANDSDQSKIKQFFTKGIAKKYYEKYQLVSDYKKTDVKVFYKIDPATKNTLIPVDGHELDKLFTDILHDLRNYFIDQATSEDLKKDATILDNTIDLAAFVPNPAYVARSHLLKNSKDSLHESKSSSAVISRLDEPVPSLQSAGPQLSLSSSSTGSSVAVQSHLAAKVKTLEEININFDLLNNFRCSPEGKIFIIRADKNIVSIFFNRINKKTRRGDSDFAECYLKYQIKRNKKGIACFYLRETETLKKGAPLEEEDQEKLFESFLKFYALRGRLRYLPYKEFKAALRNKTEPKDLEALSRYKPSTRSSGKLRKKHLKDAQMRITDDQEKDESKQTAHSKKRKCTRDSVPESSAPAHDREGESAPPPNPNGQQLLKQSSAGTEPRWGGSSPVHHAAKRLKLAGASKWKQFEEQQEMDLSESAPRDQQSATVANAQKPAFSIDSSVPPELPQHTPR